MRNAVRRIMPVIIPAGVAAALTTRECIENGDDMKKFLGFSRPTIVGCAALGGALFGALALGTQWALGRIS